MSDAEDQLSLFSHVVDELHRDCAAVVTLAEHLSRPIEGPPEPVTLEQTM